MLASSSALASVRPVPVVAGRPAGCLPSCLPHACAGGLPAWALPGPSPCVEEVTPVLS